MKFSPQEAAEYERIALANGGTVRANPVRIPHEYIPQASKRAQARKIDPDEFLASCERHGLPKPVPEWKFHPDRKWRLDWAWLEQKVALEIDGGAGWGRHTRKDGFIKDQEKRNNSLLLGWRVFHCVPADVRDDSVFKLLQRALEVPGG